MDENKNEKDMSKLEKLFKTVKRVFPNWFTEVAVTLGVLACVLFASQIIPTASLNREMAFWKNNTPAATDEVVNATQPTIEAEFEVNTETKVVETVVTYQESQMCLIGDSRTYAMETSVVSKAKFIAKSSMGLDWFNETASVEFDKIKDDVNICIVALGINDIRNAEQYIADLNAFADKYPEKIFVYVNLGPVNSELYDGIPNSSLEKFNETVTQGLSERWQVLDQYTYLTETGFDSSDGLHYSAKDSMRIFAWIVNSVKTQTIVEVIN